MPSQIFSVETSQRVYDMESKIDVLTIYVKLLVASVVIQSVLQVVSGALLFWYLSSP
jgi:predicted CoA-binding protein